MPRSIWLLVIGMTINVTGSSFLWPLNTIYMHNHLGKSLSIAGIVLMLNSLASVIGNLAGGVLFDKIGGFRSIIVGTTITLASLVGLTFFHGWPEYIVLLIVLGFGSGLIFPAMYAMAGAVWPEGGRRGFNALYVAQNLGVAVGSALGGFIAAISFDYIFIANTAMFVVFFFIAFFAYRKMADKTISNPTILSEEAPVKNTKSWRAMVAICTVYILCWVGYVQWQSTISSYTQDIGISLSQYSMLWTVNGALIVLAQPFIGVVVRKFLTSIKAQIIVGIAIFIVSYGIASTAENFHGYLAAMVILTAGEMLVWPAVPTIANHLAPKGKAGFYQGMANSAATGGRMIGPVIGGFLVDQYGMGVLYAFLIGFLIVSIVITAIYDRSLSQETKEQLVA